MTIDMEKLRDIAKAFRPEVESWYTAYTIAWLIAKAPEGLNERQLEWPWVLEEAACQEGRGEALDVGSAGTEIPDKLNELGYAVTALDCRVSEDAPPSPIRMVEGDIRSTDFPDGVFDLITCISTLEHIGVKGRYGVVEADPEGDRKAISEMLRILKPGGRILLTVPIGIRDFLPINKCYTLNRIQGLDKRLHMDKAQYFKYVEGFGWQECNQADAETVHWYHAPWYALGCFILSNKSILS